MDRLLVSVGTGHIYEFTTHELIRSTKKRAIKPEFTIDAHCGKVMRSMFCHFDPSKFVSISNDQSIAIWNDSPPVLIQRLKIPHKPNWIETFGDNILLVSDITENLSIYTLR
jgi:WD40 repeat protein